MLLAALILAAAAPPPAIVLTDLPTERPPQPMEVVVVRDPITDAVRAWAVVREDGNRLVVGCDPAEHAGVRISFHARRWLAPGNLLTGQRPVVYRFGDLPPVRMMWDVEDRRGRLSDPPRERSFLDHLLVAERLAIRARDIEGNRFDMVFRLVAVRPAVEHALAACAAAAPEPRWRRRPR